MERGGDEVGPGALADVRVIEFAQVLAVPTCGLLLADMGADVVKVEPPLGDAFRLHGRTSVRGEGRGYALFNRGKRGLCIDLGKQESRPVVERLVRGADVVLVSFKPSDVPRYGLDYERLRALRPDLVYLDNSAYGPRGPYAAEGGYDVVAQGISGLGSITGASHEGAPRLVRPAYIDMATGFLSALAVVTALRHRDRTGEGQRVSTSLLSSALALGANVIYRFEDHDQEQFDALREGLDALRAQGASFDEQQAHYQGLFDSYSVGNIYFRHFRTKDGFVSVGCLSPALNARLRGALGIDDPRRTPGFDDQTPEGVALLRAFVADVEARFAASTTAEWLALLRAHGVPCGPFHFLHEVFDEPQVRANEFLVEIDHPALGKFQTFGPPLRMERTPLRVSRPPPGLDAHGEEILRELGFGTEDIAALRSCGAVGKGTPEKGR